MAEGWVKNHLPCEDCGSSDALSINTDGYSHCFNCETHKKVDGTYVPKERMQVSTPLHSSVIDMLTHKQYRTLTDRNISRETCEKYRCFVDGEDIIFGYTNQEGAICATKTRFPHKDFTVQGDWKAAGLSRRAWCARYRAFGGRACRSAGTHPHPCVRVGTVGAFELCGARPVPYRGVGCHL